MALVDTPAPTATLSRMARSRAEVLTRIREADYRKMLKYSAVSAVAFPFTQIASDGVAWAPSTSSPSDVAIVHWRASQRLEKQGCILDETKRGR